VPDQPGPQGGQDLVEAAPKPVLEKANKTMRKSQAALEAAGATVEVK